MKRSFFETDWKKLLLFLYISSFACMVGNIFCNWIFVFDASLVRMRGPSLILVFFSQFNLICYFINYRKLVQAQTIQKSVKTFMTGFFPVITASLVTIWATFIWRWDYIVNTWTKFLG